MLLFEYIFVHFLMALTGLEAQWQLFLSVIWQRFMARNQCRAICHIFPFLVGQVAIGEILKMLTISKLTPNSIEWV